MRPFALLLLATTALPVLANNIYKWTDAQGQVHYSQTPPPVGTPAVQSQSQEKVQPGARMAAPVVPKTPEAAKPAPAAGTETAENKSKRCAAAKERQAFLASTVPRRLMVVGADGSESRMTEEQHAEAVKKAEEAGKGC